MNKLGFFPSPFPGESLASLIFRYHKLSSSTSEGETCLKLFGLGGYRQPLGLLGMFKIGQNEWLEVLSGRMPGRKAENYEVLLNKNTLHPLLYDFLGVTSAGTSFSIWGEIGHNRYCRECARENIEEYGVFYWHRAHQVPGVVCCWKHSSRLVAPSEKCKQCRPGPVAPDSDCSCLKDGAKESANSSVLVEQIKYSRFVFEILTGSIGNIPKGRLEKLIQYKLWSSRVVRTERCVTSIARRAFSFSDERLGQGWCLTNYRARRATDLGSYGFGVEQLIYFVMCVFWSFDEVSLLIKSGVLHHEFLHPDDFRIKYPNLNWRWLYRWEVVSPRIGVEKNYLAAKHWLEEFDKAWFRSYLECSNVMPWTERARSRYLRFVYKTLYMQRF